MALCEWMGGGIALHFCDSYVRYVAFYTIIALCSARSIEMLLHEPQTKCKNLCVCVYKGKKDDNKLT